MSRQVKLVADVSIADVIGVEFDLIALPVRWFLPARNCQLVSLCADSELRMSPLRGECPEPKGCETQKSCTSCSCPKWSMGGLWQQCVHRPP